MESLYFISLRFCNSIINLALITLYEANYDSNIRTLDVSKSQKLLCHIIARVNLYPSYSNKTHFVLVY